MSQGTKAPRPKIIINYACSLDGKIAFPDKSRARLSSEEDRKRVHELRGRVDAILVGIGTVLADDPSLLVKAEYVPFGNQPLRIVLDSGARTPPTAKCLFGDARTLIVTADECTKDVHGAQMLRCGKGHVDLHRLLAQLWGRNIRTILVEGGGTVLWSFISQGLFDDLFIYIAPLIIGGSTSPTGADGEGFARIEMCPNVRVETAEKYPGGGIFIHAVRA